MPAGFDLEVVAQTIELVHGAYEGAINIDARVPRVGPDANGACRLPVVGVIVTVIVAVGSTAAVAIRRVRIVEIWKTKREAQTEGVAVPVAIPRAVAVAIVRVVAVPLAGVIAVPVTRVIAVAIPRVVRRVARTVARPRLRLAAARLETASARVAGRALRRTAASCRGLRA